MDGEQALSVLICIAFGDYFYFTLLEHHNLTVEYGYRTWIFHKSNKFILDNTYNKYMFV